MAKRKKSSGAFKTARFMGENLGKLVLESKKTVKTGKKGLKVTAERLGSVERKVKRKAMTTTKETIPQLAREFKSGLRKGMKKRR